MIRYLCSVLLACTVCSSASADLPPLTPDPGFKRVWSQHVIKLEKEIPGYRFFWILNLRNSENNAGVQNVELKLSTEKFTILPELSELSLSRIVAVPNQIMEELKTVENLAKFFDRNGSIRPAEIKSSSTRSFYRDIKQDDPRSRIVMLITVSPDDKGGVKFNSQETTDPTLLQELKEVTTPNPTNKNESYDSPNQPRFATVIAGITMAVAIATAGIWFYRKKQKSR